MGLNWTKILASTGLAFLVAFSGSVGGREFFGFDADFLSLTLFSMYLAGMQAGITLFREILKEDIRVKTEVRKVGRRGYVKITDNSLDKLDWQKGYIYTLRARDVCFKTKMFATLDILILWDVLHDIIQTIHGKKVF